MRLVDADVFEKRLMDAREYYIGEKADDFDLRFAAGLMSAAERLVDAPTIDAVPKSVLEDIKAELEQLRQRKRFQYKYGQEKGLIEAIAVIDKHISRKEEKCWME